MGKALARRIKCTILYATETGRSETYANRMCEIFKHAFDAKVVCFSTKSSFSLVNIIKLLVTCFLDAAKWKHLYQDMYCKTLELGTLEHTSVMCIVM